MKTPELLSTLWERASPNLTPEDLEQFSHATESASFLLQNLEDVIDGIGCLVGGDTDEKGRIPVGSFASPGSTSTLLFFISQSIAQARGLVEIGSNASSRLEQHHRLAKKANKS